MVSASVISQNNIVAEEGIKGFENQKKSMIKL